MRQLITALALACAAGSAFAQVSPKALSDDVKILASDAFEGRGPGSAAEPLTIDYLSKRLAGIGLQPAGDNGGWTQAVTLLHSRLGEGPISVNGKPLTRNVDVYLSTQQPADKVRFQSVPMVFVGYGVTAPERGWDDFKDVDVRGKLVVMLVNDPDFRAVEGEDAYGLFGGRRMTYYGRWSYKYEEAVRRGALGALIIHDTEGAAYGWQTVIAPASENFDLANGAGGPRLLAQGWMSDGFARRLFADAGLDFEAQLKAARSKGFRPVDLKARFSADLPVSQEKVQSRNVLAKLPGTGRADEAILFGAHWDAFGIGPADAQGRTIRAGANDDALGVAGLLELARLFKASGPTSRTLLFGFWTAEERLLLGSEYYARNPVVPMAKTVANYTLDVLNTGGPSHDVILVGDGQNELEADLQAAAKAVGRRVTPDILPERGLFYRADHFSVAKRGVPTLLLMAMSGAPDLVQGGRPAGDKWLQGYMACYHQPCDNWNEGLDFRGAAEDVDLIFTISRDLANSGRWPDWRDGSEFKDVRRQSRAGDGAGGNQAR
ncbi:MAG: peptidase M20 [Sphingomonas sp.]|nr:MAG: peptidase M20 [Sphingomonas sp.]